MVTTRDTEEQKIIKCDKEGYLQIIPQDLKNSKKAYVVLNQNTLSIYTSARDTRPQNSFSLIGCVSKDLTGRVKLKYGFELSFVVDGLPTETETRIKYSFYPDSKQECNSWLGMISRASVPISWPVNEYFNGSPKHFEMFQTLPHLLDTPLRQRYSLLMKKLQLCSVLFDFSRTQYITERNYKTDTLKELADCCEKQRGLFSDFRSLNDSIQMIKTNLFRSLPKKEIVSLSEEGDEIIFVDPQWTHLNLVYDFFQTIVVSNYIDQALLRKVLDSSFLSHFLDLLSSEDPKEREYVKTITHRIYGKLTPRRTAIRSFIYQRFHQCIYDLYSQNGISEMLEILASIINGLGIPIRDEHILSLKKSLIPLHKIFNLEKFYPHLSYSMILFIKKDMSLAIPIVSGILRYWPIGNSNKELYFMNELEDIFELIDLELFTEILPQYLHRYKLCIQSPHFQIVERALLVFNKPKMCYFLVETESIRDIVLPGIFPVLFNNTQNSSTPNIKIMSNNILSLYNSVDQTSVERLLRNYINR